MRSRTLLVAVLAAAAGLAALWIVIPPIYLANDDAAIRLTVTGGDLPGEPATSYLVFTHEALARVVVALQRLLPAVFVWDVLLAAALAVGVGALLATAAAAWPRGSPRVGALCAVLVTVAPFAAGLQFTISAVMCAGAALVVAVCEMLWSERPRRSVLIAAAVLVVAGYTLRPMAVEGAVVVLLACLVPVAAAHRWWRARLLRLAAVAAIVGGTFVALDLLNRALYPERDGWAEFYTHTWQFVTLIDWNSAARDAQREAIREAAGWTPNDWDMLWKGWAGTDWTLFGPDRVANAYEVLSGSSSVIDRARAAVVGFDRRVLAELLNALAVPLGVALLFAAGVGTWRGILLAAVLVVEFLAICLAIQGGFKELPFRLLAPLVACFVAVVVVAVAEHRRASHTWFGWVAAAAIVALFAQQGWAAVQQARAEINHARSVEEQVQAMLRLKPSVVVLHGDAFPMEHWWRPFHEPPVRFSMIRLGGNNGNPRLRHFLNRTGRSRLLVSVCDDPSIFVVAEAGTIEMVPQYMLEHADRRVTVEPVFEGSFTAWRCR
ncbi:MAG: hypothetical protein FJW14_02610 [Acidimicrobiia bacterium]|nr:hypothetical protein [Acidimicrobiia bacterium]